MFSNVKPCSVRFSEVQKGLARFSKVQKSLARFSKVQKGLARFMKVLQSSAWLSEVQRGSIHMVKPYIFRSLNFLSSTINSAPHTFIYSHKRLYLRTYLVDLHHLYKCISSRK